MLCCDEKSQVQDVGSHATWAVAEEARSSWRMATSAAARCCSRRYKRSIQRIADHGAGMGERPISLYGDLYEIAASDQDNTARFSVECPELERIVSRKEERPKLAISTPSSTERIVHATDGNLRSCYLTVVLVGAAGTFPPLASGKPFALAAPLLSTTYRYVPARLLRPPLLSFTLIRFPVQPTGG